MVLGAEEPLLKARIHLDLPYGAFFWGIWGGGGCRVYRAPFKGIYKESRGVLVFWGVMGFRVLGVLGFWRFIGFRLLGVKGLIGFRVLGL